MHTFKISFFYLCSILFLFGLFSCRQTAENRELQIKPDTVQDALLSDFLSNHYFIKIQDSILLGNISKICLKKDEVYISDGFSLFILDKSGNLIKKMNKVGRAQDEYLELSDFVIIGDCIVVLDGEQQKVLMYSSSGQFIRSHTAANYISSFGVLNDSVLVLNARYTAPGNKFHLFNINQWAETNGFHQIPLARLSYSHFLQDKNFVSLNKRLLFCESMNGRVYEVRSDTAIVRYVLNINNQLPSDPFFDKEYSDVMEFMESFNRLGYICGNAFFAESEGSILFSYRGSKDANTCFYNKKTAQSHHFKRIIFSESIPAIDVFSIGIFPQDDGIIAISISPHKLIQGEKKVLDGLSENDNQVILVGQLK